MQVVVVRRASLCLPILPRYTSYDQGSIRQGSFALWLMIAKSRLRRRRFELTFFATSLTCIQMLSFEETLTVNSSRLALHPSPSIFSRPHAATLRADRLAYAAMCTLRWKMEVFANSIPSDLLGDRIYETASDQPGNCVRPSMTFTRAVALCLSFDYAQWDRPRFCMNVT